MTDSHQSWVLSTPHHHQGTHTTTDRPPALKLLSRVYKEARSQSSEPCQDENREQAIGKDQEQHQLGAKAAGYGREGRSVVIQGAHIPPPKSRSNAPHNPRRILAPKQDE